MESEPIRTPEPTRTFEEPTSIPTLQKTLKEFFGQDLNVESSPPLQDFCACHSEVQTCIRLLSLLSLLAPNCLLIFTVNNKFVLCSLVDLLSYILHVNISITNSVQTK